MYDVYYVPSFAVIEETVFQIYYYMIIHDLYTKQIKMYQTNVSRTILFKRRNNALQISDIFHRINLCSTS